MIVWSDLRRLLDAVRPRNGADIDPRFTVAEVARLWSLDTEKTKLWRVRLHRANASVISAAIFTRSALDAGGRKLCRGRPW